MTDKEIKDKIINGIKDWFDDVEGYNYSTNHRYMVFTIKDYDKAIISYFTVGYEGMVAQINTGNLDIDGMIKHYKQQAIFLISVLFGTTSLLKAILNLSLKRSYPIKTLSLLI